jgi:hypothetical protein
MIGLFFDNLRTSGNSAAGRGAAACYGAGQTDVGFDVGSAAAC